uniref:Mitofusin-1 n=1 Tax=Schizaphis graminum TaxID=13262 RepID=A0A2S2NI88_SCHGA
MIIIAVPVARTHHIVPCRTLPICTSCLLSSSSKSVQHLSRALNYKKPLNEKDLLVHLYWPKYKCTLLNYDVGLIDSPGIGIKLNDYIEKQCIDADVFVFVMHGSSTMMDVV